MSLRIWQSVLLVSDLGFIEKNKRISVYPDKERVLSVMGCIENSEIYESISKEFDSLYERIKDALDVRRTIFADDGKIYVLISAGARISTLSEELFACGEGLAGLIVNNAADDVIFAADTLTSERIKYYLGALGLGVSERLEAPRDIPVSEQAVIVAKAPLEGVSVTDAFLISPVKSLGYILRLTDNENVFAAQHDCSKCPNMNCVRRDKTAGKGFKIISDFEYRPQTACGVAIDIGTTTVALARFENGREVSVRTELNAQRRFGTDVLSRIEAANRGRGAELQALISYQLAEMIKESGAEKDRVVIAGNTAMISLLMGYSCVDMGVYPFVSKNLDNIFTGNRSIAGGISTFVGGDITSGLYMCGFDESEDVNLFIDLGTNGEMAIGNRDRILCTSTAAGPAFEGGRISCGTGSVEGAVCAVNLKDGRLDTIGNKPPCGICGTGITELAAELLDAGLMDRTGLLSESLGGAYALTDDISFTQKDVREFQTAKAAIRAGIEVLLREYGLPESEICNVYIAGGFGKRLNIEKACRTGLLPERFLGRYRAVGNSSLGGCVKLLETGDGFDRLNLIKKAALDFALAQNPQFTELFIKYMDF